MGSWFADCVDMAYGPYHSVSQVSLSPDVSKESAV